MFFMTKAKYMSMLARIEALETSVGKINQGNKTCAEPHHTNVKYKPHPKMTDYRLCKKILSDGVARSVGSVVKEIKKSTGIERNTGSVNVVLSQLYRAGWAIRPARGVYRKK